MHSYIYQYKLLFVVKNGVEERPQLQTDGNSSGPKLKQEFMTWNKVKKVMNV